MPPRRSLLALGRSLLVLSMLGWVAAAAAGESTRRRHAAILARALSYELTLDDRAGDSVGVAVTFKPGNARSEANANQWFEALSELSSLKIKDKPFFVLKVPYDPGALAAAIDKQGADVILVADGLNAEVPKIAELASRKHVLTASNDLALVQRDVTLCVTTEDDKIRVVINLNAAQREGIRFSSNLLKVSKLIR